MGGQGAVDCEAWAVFFSSISIQCSNAVSLGSLAQVAGAYPTEILPGGYLVDSDGYPQAWGGSLYGEGTACHGACKDQGYSLSSWRVGRVVCGDQADVSPAGVDQVLYVACPPGLLDTQDHCRGCRFEGCHSLHKLLETDMV